MLLSQKVQFNNSMPGFVQIDFFVNVAIPGNRDKSYVEASMFFCLPVSDPCKKKLLTLGPYKPNPE